jgi:hypothetical protein
MSITFGPRIDSTCAICYNDLGDPDYRIDKGTPEKPELKSDLFVSPCDGRHTFHYACAKQYFDAKRVASRSAKCPVCVQPPQWTPNDFPPELGLEERQAMHAAQERERRENADRTEAVRLHEAEIRARQEGAVADGYADAARAALRGYSPIQPRSLFGGDEELPRTVTERLARSENARVAAIERELSLRNLLERGLFLLFNGQDGGEGTIEAALADGLDVNLGLVLASGYPGYPGPLEIFLAHGADVNAVVNTRPPSLTGSGRGVGAILETPLSRARANGRQQIVQWLLDHGAVDESVEEMARRL